MSSGPSQDEVIAPIKGSLTVFRAEVDVMNSEVPGLHLP